MKRALLSSLASIAAVVVIYLHPASAFALLAAAPALAYPRATARGLIWIADVFAPKRKKGVMRTAAANPTGNTKAVPVNAEADADLASALRNLGMPPAKARKLAQSVPAGNFDQRMRAAIQMARAA